MVGSVRGKSVTPRDMSQSLTCDVERTLKSAGKSALASSTSRCTSRNAQSSRPSSMRMPMRSRRNTVQISSFSSLKMFSSVFPSLSSLYTSFDCERHKSSVDTPSPSAYSTASRSSPGKRQ